jgi:hypothetical protein
MQTQDELQLCQAARLRTTTSFAGRDEEEEYEVMIEMKVVVSELIVATPTPSS